MGAGRRSSGAMDHQPIASYLLPVVVVCLHLRFNYRWALIDDWRASVPWLSQLGERKARASAADPFDSQPGSDKSVKLFAG